MSQSFIISAVVFISIMTGFHLIKDIILKDYNINSTQKEKLNRRWLISIAIGLVILFLLYSCAKTVDPCNKGPSVAGVVCTEIYDPVCVNGETYPNSCYAQKDGWDNSCLTKCRLESSL